MIHNHGTRHRKEKHTQPSKGLLVTLSSELVNTKYISGKRSLRNECGHDDDISKLAHRQSGIQQCCHRNHSRLSVNITIA